MRKLRPLYIIGAGGFGREAAWLVERLNAVSPTWSFRGFIDDDDTLLNKEVDGYKVHSDRDVLESEKEDVWCAIAIGDAYARKKRIERLKPFSNVHYPVLIDPDARISNRVRIGDGTIICAGTTVTVDVEIGKHNIINLDCTVGHDAKLDDYVTLYPNVNVSGAVKIGECSEIGVGSKIIQGLEIGSGVVVGANSGVFRDIQDYATALGNPARVMKKNKV